MTDEALEIGNEIANCELTIDDLTIITASLLTNLYPGNIYEEGTPDYTNYEAMDKVCDKVMDLLSDAVKKYSS